jgi:DNA-binding NarL/FixJ family response regulator
VDDSRSSHRIVLVDLTQLVADMIERAVDGAEDVVIVGRASSLSELAQVAEAASADVVVAGLDAPGLALACREVLFERPHSIVLGVVEDLGRTYLYVLRPEEIDLGELSPAEMVQMIRDTRPHSYPT